MGSSRTTCQANFARIREGPLTPVVSDQSILTHIVLSYLPRIMRLSSPWYLILPVVQSRGYRDEWRLESARSCYHLMHAQQVINPVRPSSRWTHVEHFAH